MSLIYRNIEANFETDLTAKENWLITIADDGKFIFQRFINGAIEESYSSKNKDVAAIYAVSIIQGFQPPRDLVYPDKRAG